jgi:hypothetical protein
MDAEHICDSLRALREVDVEWSGKLDLALAQVFAPEAVVGAKPTARKVGRVLRAVHEAGWLLAGGVAGPAVVEAAGRCTGTVEASARLQELLVATGAGQNSAVLVGGKIATRQSDRQQQLSGSSAFS